MYQTYILKKFYLKLKMLRQAVVTLQLKGNTTHQSVKLYESIKRCMLEIANDPTSDKYLLGNTMGKEHRDWRRSKQYLPNRYRLFFKYFSKELEIYYAWLNDENTLRKDGAKTDCYNVFQSFLDSETISSDRENLQNTAQKIDIEKL